MQGSANIGTDKGGAEGNPSCDRWANGTDMFLWYISNEPAPNEDMECGLYT
jgi:hypothetical protein